MADMGKSKTVAPAMNEGQAQSDRVNWKIPAGMTTGNSDIVDALAGGGPEVGNNYDGDPLGENYGGVTYGGK